MTCSNFKLLIGTILLTPKLTSLSLQMPLTHKLHMMEQLSFVLVLVSGCVGPDS